MSQAIRDQINSMTAEARELALRACLQPKVERDYLLICGRVQQLVATARVLKAKFLDSDPEAQESPLPDADDLDSYDDSPPPRQPAAPRRARPEPDRLQRARDRHTPRSI
jgi:hypothetical protein